MAIKTISLATNKVRPKHEVLTGLVKNKKVVHYGCIDDDEQLIRHKFKSGIYLHKLVTDSANSVVGIDINKRLIRFLADDLGITNVYYGDVEDVSTFDVKDKTLKNAQLVLIPDLIEHLNNPGRMLDGIANKFSKQIKLVIVTPNPTAWYNFGATLLRKEIYSPYHTIYFTPESMSVLLNRYGFQIDKLSPLVSPKRRGLLLRILDGIFSKSATLISPAFADLYMYECSRKKT